MKTKLMFAPDAVQQEVDLLRKHLPLLLEVSEHELNSIRVMMYIWHEEIPGPVHRSIAMRIRKIERMIRKTQRLLF